MQQSQSPEPSFAERCNNTLSWLVFISRAVSAPVEVILLRRGFGPRYLGLHAAAAIPAMLLYTLGWPYHDLRPLLVWILLYLVACFFHRLDGVRRRLRGEHGHSFYSGRPVLMRLFKRSDEVAVKGTLEPLAVFGLTLVVLPFDQPLGTYLLFSAVALMVNSGASHAYERARAMDLHDAVFEQELIAERVRAMRGDRF